MLLYPSKCYFSFEVLLYASKPSPRAGIREGKECYFTLRSVILRFEMLLCNSKCYFIFELLLYASKSYFRVICLKHFSRQDGLQRKDVILYVLKCYFSLPSATLRFEVLLIASKCYFTFRSVSVRFEMLFYVSKCYFTFRTATLRFELLFYASKRCFRLVFFKTLLVPRRTAEESSDT